jgi:tetratricopeptide (TPR) repeat protein
MSALGAAFRAAPPRADLTAIRAKISQTLRAPAASPLLVRAGTKALVRLSFWPDLADVDRLQLLEQADVSAARARSLNPRDAANYALAATVSGELAAQQQSAGRLAEAVQNERRAAEDWQRAVELYPTGTDHRMAAGAAWMAVWQRTADREAARRAAEHFRAALHIDAARPLQEVMRLRPAQRQRALEALDILAPSTTSSHPQVGGS